jgi:hypothetical protein
MSLFRKLLIVFHRYLGIVLCLLFVVWFLSGIAMIYVKGMPALTSESRFAHLPLLDFGQIHLSPSEAAERARLSVPPPRASLQMVMDRPAYRFSVPEFVTVFADTGQVMNPPGDAETVSIASRFMNLPESALHHVRVLTDLDQWTIGKRNLLPLHRISVDDAAHTELYVSGQTGEVAVVSTRGSRALAWISAIPHWFYFEALRTNQRWWVSAVLWTSGLGTVLVLMGLALAVIQYSRRPPHIPYAGWLRWHYITGAFFGVFTLTWVFSGFLSMEPWGWASEGGLGEGMRAAFSGGPLDLKQFPLVPAGFPVKDVKEIEFLRIQGDPYYSVRTANPNTVLVSADPLSIREGHVFDGVSCRQGQGSQSEDTHCGSHGAFNLRFLLLRSRRRRAVAGSAIEIRRPGQDLVLYRFEDGPHPGSLSAARTIAAMDLSRLSQPGFFLLVLQPGRPGTLE